MANMIQGFPIQADNIMSLPTLGLWPINSVVCYKLLVLMWQYYYYQCIMRIKLYSLMCSLC